VKHTGDGFLAIFEGPGRALAAAARIRDGVHALDIEVRQGVHVGEIEMGSHDVTGENFFVRSGESNSHSRKISDGASSRR